MDAETYLQSFRATNEILAQISNVPTQEHVNRRAPAITAETIAVEALLHMLYAQGLRSELHLDPSAGQAMKEAIHDAQDTNSEAHAVAKENAVSYISAMLGDAESHGEAAVVTDLLSTNATVHNHDLTNLREYAMHVTSLLHKDKDAGYDEQVAGVRQALRTTRSTRAREFTSLRGHMVIARSVDNDTDQIIDTSARMQDTNRVLPDWLTQPEHWDTMLSRIGAMLNELDCLHALQEWVIAKGLPILPILAPYAAEQGEQLNRDTEGNLHADILLLDMSCDQVYPVQIKHTRRSRRAYVYHPQIITITPLDLGLVAAEPARLITEAGVKTGTKIETSYGGILDTWRRTFATKQQGKRNEKLLRERLNHAFLSFDTLVLPALNIGNPAHAERS